MVKKEHQNRLTTYICMFEKKNGFSQTTELRFFENKNKKIVPKYYFQCLNLCDEVRDGGGLLLAGRQVLVPLQQRLQVGDLVYCMSRLCVLHVLHVKFTAFFQLQHVVKSKIYTYKV